MHLIVWSKAATWHATADDHGFDLSNNSGIAAPGVDFGGNHVAPLGLVFSLGTLLPEQFRGGALSENMCRGTGDHGVVIRWSSSPLPAGGPLDNQWMC